MAAYYNELDPYAAQWIRNLIAAGHIADGVVDNRSISDVEPNDLRGFTQCHFFAGIGVWSFALRLAGWPDERGVWTGSCPCQPFSVAGAANGFSDERHLWPHWHHLIRECRPQTVFGEQVASKDGLNWLDLVQADLEGENYAFAANDLCAAGVGAPHIRQRLYFVADAGLPESQGWNRYPEGLRPDGNSPRCESASRRPVGLLGDDDDEGLEGQRLRHQAESGRHGAVRPVAEAGEFGGLADHDDNRFSAAPIGEFHHTEHNLEPCCGIRGMEPPMHFGRQRGQTPAPGNDDDGKTPKRPEGEHGFGLSGTYRVPQDGARPTNGHWRDADWLFCRDGKWRPVEPGTFPLAHGVTSRVGRLRAYGNAIVPQVAQAFIEAFLETRP